MAPLRFDTPAEQCVESRKRTAGAGAQRLLAALLGSLLLSPAAGAAPEAPDIPGGAAILGGVIQMKPDGDRPPAQPATVLGPPEESVRVTPGLGTRSGPVAAASPPNPEPGVLVPRTRELGNDQPIRPATPASNVSAPPKATSDTTKRELVLDRRRRELLVIDNGMPLRRFPVAVGMPGWETPLGRFAVIEMRTNPVWEHPVSGHRIQPGPDNPLGSRWIGFHRDCQGRSGFNGKEHLVVQGCVVAGFHGTPNRASIGQAASHGCVRLYDEHVRDLFDLVRVGTPVTVLP